MKNKKRIHYAFIILLAISLIRGISGPAINASSGLFLPTVSTDLSVGMGKLSLYLSISSIGTLIWLPIAGNLLNQYSAKFIALLGVFLQTLSFMALGLMKSVWGFYILSIPMAMGGTILVNLLGPIMINRWFTSKIGLIMGIMMTITSLLGAVFQPLLSFLIEAAGWRATYLLFGAAAFGMLIILIVLLLRNRPQDQNMEPYQGNTVAAAENKASAVSFEGLTAAEASRTLSFYLVLFFMIVLTAFAVFSQHMTAFGLDLGFTITTIGTALSLSMIGSAVGSILVGILGDKIGIVKTCVLVSVTAALSIVLFFACDGNFVLFAGAAFLHGLATSSIGVVAPLLTTTFFGRKDYEKLFSRIMMGSPLASVILMPVYGFIYDYTGSYMLVFLFLLLFLLLGVLTLLFAGRQKVAERS